MPILKKLTYKAQECGIASCNSQEGFLWAEEGTNRCTHYAVCENHAPIVMEDAESFDRDNEPLPRGSDSHCEAEGCDGECQVEDFDEEQGQRRLDRLNADLDGDPLADDLAPGERDDDEDGADPIEGEADEDDSDEDEDEDGRDEDDDFLGEFNNPFLDPELP